MQNKDKTYFKRKIYDKMLDWKNWSRGHYALLIEGARRVGKSTVAQQFAQREYDDYIIIDFSNTTDEIRDVFNYTHDLDLFFMRLQILTSKTLVERKSVIIFDEVQFYPKARQAIKQLVADGRYDYIETGSLISIKRNVQDILIPSEEHKIAMYPMDFEEYLWAINNVAMADVVRQHFNMLKPLGDTMHRVVMREFRQYMIVGGMPQAIMAYIETHDFTVIDRTKREILSLYEEDFRKIDQSGRATTIFDSIPSQLSRNTTSYKVGSVIPEARPSRLSTIFADIRDSKTVNFAYHANDPSIGLRLHADLDNFKIYLADTGLFITLAFRDGEALDNEVYRKLLFDKLSADLGFVYENVVAQLLQTSGHSLYYYTFKSATQNADNERKYEIDFIISTKDKICPIEVKSSGYKTHKSLDMFQQKYSSRIGQRYLIYTKDVNKENDIICLPVYMTGLL